MWFESLWTKTLIGTVLGWLVTVSLFMNLGVIMASSRQVFLLLYVFAGITLWGGILSWFYCVRCMRRPVLICSAVLGVSILVNVLIYAGGNA